MKGFCLNLSDLEAGKNISEIFVRVVSKAPPRIITTRSGRKTQLTEVLVADNTGSVVLSLWGFGEGASISVGSVIRITDGWVKEWQGKIQLSLGRSGKFEEIADDGSIPSITELAAKCGEEIEE